MHASESCGRTATILNRIGSARSGLVKRGRKWESLLWESSTQAFATVRIPCHLISCFDHRFIVSSSRPRAHHRLLSTLLPKAHRLIILIDNSLAADRNTLGEYCHEAWLKRWQAGTGACIMLTMPTLLRTRLPIASFCTGYVLSRTTADIVWAYSGGGSGPDFAIIKPADFVAALTSESPPQGMAASMLQKVDRANAGRNLLSAGKQTTGTDRRFGFEVGLAFRGWSYVAAAGQQAKSVHPSPSPSLGVLSLTTDLDVDDVDASADRVFHLEVLADGRVAPSGPKAITTTTTTEAAAPRSLPLGRVSRSPAKRSAPNPCLQRQSASLSLRR